MWQSHDLKEEVLKNLIESSKGKNLKMKSLVAELLSTGLAAENPAPKEPSKAGSKKNVGPESTG